MRNIKLYPGKYSVLQSFSPLKGVVKRRKIITDEIQSVAKDMTSLVKLATRENHMRYLVTALCISISLILIMEHCFLGYHMHYVLMENQVLKTQLAEAQSSERALGLFAKSLMPMTIAMEDAENAKDKNRGGKADKKVSVKTPQAAPDYVYSPTSGLTPSPGILVDGKGAIQ